MDIQAAYNWCLHLAAARVLILNDWSGFRSRKRCLDSCCSETATVGKSLPKSLDLAAIEAPLIYRAVRIMSGTKLTRRAVSTEIANMWKTNGKAPGAPPLR